MESSRFREAEAMKAQLEGIFRNGVDSKGIGRLLKKMPTPFGPVDIHKKVAVLFRYSDGGFNVVLVHPIITESDLFYEPEFLFDKPVSEEEARRSYDCLQ